MNLKLLTALFALFYGVKGTNLFQCDLNDFYRGFNPSDYNNPTDLKRALHSYIDGHVIIPYKSTDEAMLVIDSNGQGGITGFYCLESRYDFPGEWNREHIWPRSRGVGDSGADTSDLFALHPTDVNLNSARGNKYFDECTPGVGSCVSPAGTSTEDAAEGSMESSTIWAPPPSKRGDAARAIFYMATRYDGSDSSTTALKIKECATQSSCGSNTFGRLSTLLKWHREDPVSAEERARNNGICNSYQGNRNPYIDFPELVELVYGDASIAETGILPENTTAVAGIIGLVFLVFGIGIFVVGAMKKRAEFLNEKELSSNLELTL